MRKLLEKICQQLEKKLYDEPTVAELYKALDKTRYKLHEARLEIEYLQSLLKQFSGGCRGQTGGFGADRARR